MGYFLGIGYSGLQVLGIATAQKGIVGELQGLSRSCGGGARRSRPSPGGEVEDQAAIAWRAP
jgi:hypothetical protein